MPMTYEFAQQALPWVVAGHTVGCLLVGYLIGSARTFASLSYVAEGLGESLKTMLPFYGVPKVIRKRRAEIRKPKLRP